MTDNSKQFRACREQGIEYLKLKKKYGDRDPKASKAYAEYQQLFNKIYLEGKYLEYGEYCRRNNQ